VRITGHGHDNLKLESLKPLQAVIQWPQPLDSYPLALVDFNTVDHVTLRGFTVTGPFAPTYDNTDRHEGLLVENAFDEHIHHNHITEIRDIRVLSRGDQEGDAVAIGRRTLGTQPGSAHVDHNLIDTYQKNGVQVVNNGTSTHVDHNVIIGPDAPNLAGPNGVVVIRGAAATVDHNLISNNQYVPSIPISSGVIVFQAPAGSSRVDHNRIIDNDNGIQTYIQQTGLEISHNDVFQSLADAIVLCGDATQGCVEPVTDNVVRSNKIESNGGSGVLLLDADANLLKKNEAKGNGAGSGDTTDGLRVDANSTDNEILGNKLDQNVTHDCHDDSTGSGTAGTANTWQGDEGDTENRAGLCKGATTTP